MSSESECCSSRRCLRSDRYVNVDMLHRRNIIIIIITFQTLIYGAAGVEACKSTSESELLGYQSPTSTGT